MKKRVTRMLVSLLAMAMLLSACGANKEQQSAESSTSKVESSQGAVEATGEESAYPEYLNMDSAYPVIKDEYAGQIKLKLAIVMDPSASDWDDLWVSKYLKEKYNMEFEVDVIAAEALSERKTLLLNSGELPDIMINLNLSTSELVKYGQQEGVLLAMDEYLSEELTPSILKYQETLDSYCTTGDGHVYTLPMMTNGATDGGYYDRYFVNKAVLDELGIAMPTTLDEFVDAMYKVKEAYPNMYPFGGGLKDTTAGYYLLQALGYMTNDSLGLSPAIRDGKVVIPAYDIDVFKEYLSILKQFYDDGIITPDYFTIEHAEVNTMVVEGRTIVYGNAPLITGIDTWSDWTSLLPLTSEWQTEPEVPTPLNCTVGGFAISADTEYPELCLRFADIFYNNETDVCGYFWGGVGQESEYTFDYVMARVDDADGKFRIVASDLPEEFAATGSSFSYQVSQLYGGLWQFGAYDTYESSKVEAYDAYGLEYPETPVRNYETNSDHHFRWTIEQNVIQYAADSYPSIYYVDEETANRITDLGTVINPYAEEQIALFISGGRSLDEVDAFAEELKGMGMDELLQIYTDAYNK